MKQFQQDIAVSLSFSYFSNQFSFIYIMSVKIKIVSKHFTEPDSQQATVARKKLPYNRKKSWAGPDFSTDGLLGKEGGGEYSLKYYYYTYC